MRAPFNLNQNRRSSDGFSAIDLLIAVVIIMIIISYACVTVIQAERRQVRVGAAQQFVNDLETARNDSVRRRAIETQQMAQVTILNDSFYTVTVDGNGDGVLDAPRVVSVIEQHLKITGPFPRTFLFDSSGRIVDASHNAIDATTVMFGNQSGKTAVSLPAKGRPTVIEAIPRSR